jgi:hypothetical protein
VRFNEDILSIKIGLCLWLDSPASYRTMRKLSLEHLPCPRQLERYYRLIKAKEGDDAVVYGRLMDHIFAKATQEDRAVRDSDLIVGIYWDEMHLLSQFYSNVMNGGVQYFAKNQAMKASALESSVQRLLEVEEPGDEEEENDPKYTFAKQVNQFRVQTLSGYAANGEFYYNNVSNG